MTIAETRKEIIAAFGKWYQGSGIGNAEDVFAFLKYLRDEQPHLLEFKQQGEEYQTIKSWLIRANRIAD